MGFHASRKCYLVVKWGLRHDTNTEHWKLWCSASVELLIEARLEEIKRWHQNSVNIENIWIENILTNIDKQRNRWQLQWEKLCL